MREMEVLAIYLYTTNVLYKDVNGFLRDHYINNLSEQEKDILPKAGWISRGVRRAQTYRGIGYRGVGGIDLKKALNLDRHYPAKG